MITAAAIRLMVELGLTAENIADVCELMAPAKSSGAARQARYREKKRGDVTSDVTSDASRAPLPLSSEEKVSPTPPSKTQPSLPIPSPPYNPPAPRKAFDVFWAAWEPKVSKGQAERTFAKVIKTVDLETILAGVHRAKTLDSRWTDGCPQHASTWLNAKGWLDEPKASMRRAANWRELEAENNDASYRGAAMALEIMKQKDRMNDRPGQDGIIDGSCAALSQVEPNGSGAGALVVRLSERLAGTLARGG